MVTFCVNIALWLIVLNVSFGVLTLINFKVLSRSSFSEVHVGIFEPFKDELELAEGKLYVSIIF